VIAARRDSLRIELACFAALAAFAAMQWLTLVDHPPVLRATLVVAIATAAGASLARLAGSGLGSAARWLAAVAISLAALALTAIVIGLPARLLLPGGWDQLGNHLNRSLEGVGSVSVPYDGTDGWTRLTILLAVPLTIALAAAATFWPARRRSVGRACGLVLLLTLYATTVAWRAPQAELGQGVILLCLLAAWLWAPVLTRRGAALAAIGIGSAALAAVPLAAAIDANTPFWNYRSWRLFGAAGVGFNWDHSYGPLDWPQRGTLLLTVASDGAHYWKTENLDRFDGFGWSRSSRPAPEPFLGEPAILHDSRGEGLRATNPWVDRINFEIRGLQTDVVVGAGTTLGVRRAQARPSSDAVWTLTGPLNRGDSYTVLAYTPDPSAEQMRAAGTAYPDAATRYTELSLDDLRFGHVEVPFWPHARSPAIADRFAGTDYAATYALARRLTQGARTPYDATRRLERALRTGYAYDQEVPQHELPLPAFLFEDRRGYCQQFSGAMALMLRMIGVPTRVATGFAPGGRDPDRGTFLVEDLDAHSWVEVFFPGIGWVPFEPTPAQAPAEAQLDDNAIGATDSGQGPSFAGIGDRPVTDSSDPGADRASRSQPLVHSPNGGGSGLGASTIAAIVGPALLLAIVLAGITIYLARVVRRRRLDPGRLAEAELEELRRALGRLGWKLDGGATLLQLEQRLSRELGPAAVAYAARLRELRFRDPTQPPPDTAARRALRRALLAAGGRRALLALPPGGPRLEG
jgi:transglutaminase-like putative cysteine protease